MPNDIDTDLADVAAGTEDPTQAGQQASDQDVAAASALTPGPLAGGMQGGGIGTPTALGLPPMTAQPPPGYQAPAQPTVGPPPTFGPPAPPVGAAVHARHGGLLTGLAGVLLDGLAAGIMTPQSGQGFSQAASRAYNMPMERAQNQALLQQFKTQQELDKAQTSLAHVKQLQGYALAMRLNDEQIAQLTDEQVTAHDQWQEQGLVDQIASSPNREEAGQTLNQMRIQDPDQSDQYWMWPTGHDGQGNITGWGIYKMDPNKTLGKDQTRYVPATDPETGEMTMEPVKLPGTMRVVDANNYFSEKAVQGLMKVKPDKQDTDLIAPFDPNTGKREFMSRGQARARGLDFTAPKITAPQQEKYATAQRQYNDPQMGVSQYRAAVDEEAAQDPSVIAADSKFLNLALREEGIMQGKLTIPEVGKLELPVVDAASESIDRIIKADAYKNLSPAGKHLLTAYQQGLAALPEYQRALMESARAGSNPQQISLDMRTWANPIDVTRDANLAQDRMEAFQQRLDQAQQGIPNLKTSMGIDSLEDVRARWEPRYRAARAAGGGTAAQPATQPPPPRAAAPAGQGAPTVMTGKTREKPGQPSKPVVSYDGGKTWQLAQ